MMSKIGHQIGWPVMTAEQKGIAHCLTGMWEYPILPSEILVCLVGVILAIPPTSWTLFIYCEEMKELDFISPQ